MRRKVFGMLTVEAATYFIAFVDLVPVATDKVRQSYPVEYCIWNRWKSTLRARSIRVNLNLGTEK